MKRAAIIRSFYNLFHNMGLKPNAQTELQGDLAVRGALSTLALANPAAPTVTPVGTAGATTYTYKVTATVASRETAASAGGSTATGNATLSASNFNRLSWSRVPGATGYKVYRTVGAATQGLISTITSGATLTVDDTGLAGGGETPTTVNRTGFLIGQSKVLSFSINTAAGGWGGSRSYTGFGFKPQALDIMAFPEASTNARDITYAFVDNSATCTSSYDISGRYTQSGLVVNKQGVNYIEASFTSLDDDGFTLNWTTVPNIGTVILFVRAMP